MSAFEIPVKELVVNDDARVRLLADGGTAYQDGDVNGATVNFQLEGFLGEVSPGEMQTLYNNAHAGANAHKIIVNTYVAAAAEVITFTVTSTACTAGDTFRIVFDQLDKESVEYQNDPIQHIYQVASTESTAATVAQAMETAINAHANAKVSVTRSSAELTITALETGVKVYVYSETIVGTRAETTPASTQINGYDDLKSKFWPKNLDFDRNEDIYPHKGVQYTSYYFEVNSTGFVHGNQDIPSVVPPTARTGFRLYVAAGTTLLTAMNLLAGDTRAFT